MSAADDFPLPEGLTSGALQRREMLAEIDALRADCAAKDDELDPSPSMTWPTP